jgi:predicted ester cyclase
VADYRQMLEMTHKFFPNLTLSILRILSNPSHDTVTILCEYTGNHMTDELFGIKASGKEVHVKGMTLLEISDGLVKKETGIIDNLTLLSQLGLFNKKKDRQ